MGEIVRRRQTLGVYPKVYLLVKGRIVIYPYYLLNRSVRLMVPHVYASNPQAD